MLCYDSRRILPLMPGVGKKFSLFCLAVAIILLAFELAILLKVRQCLPGGISPTLHYTHPPAEITGQDSLDWIMYDPKTLDEIRSTIEADIPGIGELPPTEQGRVLRDWTRRQATRLKLRPTPKDPVRILAELRAGEGASCEPLADLCLAALNSFGIPARRVALFGYPGGFDQVHSSVEMWDGRKWIIQDPTFNSVACGPSGEMLSAAMIQENYARGLEVRWVQDATVLKPDFDTYAVPPSTLFNVLVYQLYGYPVGEPRWQLWLARLRDRLAGRVQSIILSAGPFPIPDYILSGTADRFLLGAALILICLSILPWKRGKGHRRE